LGGAYDGLADVAGKIRGRSYGDRDEDSVGPFSAIANIATSTRRCKDTARDDDAMSNPELWT
jgi:hypothetical protein